MITCLKPNSVKLSSDRLVFAGYQTYAVRGLNVVSERLFIQPMLWGKLVVYTIGRCAHQ